MGIARVSSGSIEASSRPSPSRGLTVWGRLAASGLALSCLAILMMGAALDPDPSGLGTHEQLGLTPCPWLLAYGLPCPTCGMTTAVSSAAHGAILRSFGVQPAGAVFAISVAALMWGALHAAATGSLVLRALWRMAQGWIGAAIAATLLAGWVYTLLGHAT